MRMNIYNTQEFVPMMKHKKRGIFKLPSSIKCDMLLKRKGQNKVLKGSDRLAHKHCIAHRRLSTHIKLFKKK